MFDIKADTRNVEDALNRRLMAAFARERVRSLEQTADGIIASIRRRRIWPNETRGILKQGLWRGEVQSTKDDAHVDMGWSGKGAAFGPGHEFGFKKARWRVAPVNVSAKTGQPVKALRFVHNGIVCYSRGHMVGAPRVLKPHFKPAAEAYPTQRRMGEALDRAVQRAGL